MYIHPRFKIDNVSVIKFEQLRVLLLIAIESDALKKNSPKPDKND